MQAVAESGCFPADDPLSLDYENGNLRFLVVCRP